MKVVCSNIFSGERVFERFGSSDVTTDDIVDAVAVLLSQRRRQFHLRRGLQARQPAARRRSQPCLRTLVKGSNPAFLGRYDFYGNVGGRRIGSLAT